MRILLVKLSSIGDVVHALPALAAIVRALPDAEVSWVVERGAAEILRDNKLLARLIEVDTRGLRRTAGWRDKYRLAAAQFADLRRTKFDVAIDFQGLLKSALLARLSGAKRRVGFAPAGLREPAARFLYTETVGIDSRVNVIEKNLRLAQSALDFTAPEKLEFPIYVGENHRREAAEIIGRVGRNFVILNAGGGWPTKLWDAPKFGLLADEIWRRYALPAVIMINPGEENLAQTALANHRSQRLTAVSLSLKSYFALAQQAALYIGGDTSLTHLAAAAETPIVGLFGPTEWRRNGSLQIGDIGVERTDIGCRENCHRRQCDKWICLDIEVKTVMAAVEQRLNQQTTARKLNGENHFDAQPFAANIQKLA